MHKLLERQIKRLKRRATDGELSVDDLLDVVSTTYEETDIERRRTERSMQLVSEELLELNRQVRSESEVYVATVLAQVRDGVLTCDAKGYIQSFNSAMEQLFRITEENATGCHISQILPKLNSAFRVFYERHFPDSESTVSVELDARDNTGHRFPVEVSATLLQSRGKDLYVVLFRDISKHKQIQQSLLRAKEDAVYAAEQKSNFLSTMSHEIRTPMNAVVGITNLLLMDNPREDQVERLNTLKFSSENLLTLINDVLDFNKIDAGRLDLESESFSLPHLLNQVCANLEVGAQTKGLEVIREIDSSLPEVVVGDETRLSQILLNLCSNATKFTEHGAVTLQASLVEESDDGYLVRFAISDTGIGIEESRLANIFDDFTQANASITRKYGGTGLGLAISQRLLKLHGSEMEVFSQPGMGSSFMFELGFDKAVADQSAVEESAVDAMHHFGGFPVLVVEDNKVNQMVAEQFLTRWGLHVDIAENGKIATDMVALKDYSLVLMDLQMPVMDGYTATEIIRNMPEKKYRQLPIVALTASVEAAEKITMRQLGINAVISKPFQPLQLNQVLAQHLT